MLRPPDEEPDEAQMRERIIARLWDVTATDGRMSFDYALEWQPGVAELLAVDYPDRVSILSDGSVREMAPLGPWYDRARRNLWRELTETAEVRVETVEHDGHRFQCALSESVYTASGALLLADLLSRWVPGIDLSGAAMAATVMGDDAIALRQEEQHLRVPIVRRQRPAMVEDDRLRVLRAPVLVEDLGSVRSCESRHS